MKRKQLNTLSASKPHLGQVVAIRELPALMKLVSGTKELLWGSFCDSLGKRVPGEGWGGRH